MVTTIQLTEDTKEKIKSFGQKGETYEDIIKKLYTIAVNDQLRDFLLSSENTISLEEAKTRHNKKWSR
tara:strand:+ start:1973 stop:2176 length:204 start_codon:yes stop_codon:yes gene_type:complete